MVVSLLDVEEGLDEKPLPALKGVPFQTAHTEHPDSLVFAKPFLPPFFLSQFLDWLHYAFLLIHQGNCENIGDGMNLHWHSI